MSRAGIYGRRGLRDVSTDLGNKQLVVGRWQRISYANKPCFSLGGIRQRPSCVVSLVGTGCFLPRKVFAAVRLSSDC
jgi:hypothetical protein